jgi:hypothetical protein
MADEREQTVRGSFLADLLGDPRLAHARLAADHHQRTSSGHCVFDVVPEVCALGIPSDELRLAVNRRGAFLRRARGLARHLEEAPPLGEAFQPEQSTVDVAQVRTHTGEILDDVRDQDLTTARLAGDPRCGVDGGAEQVARLLGYLTGVDPDPHADLFAGTQPVTVVERSLDLHRAGDGFPGRRERHHEAVAEGFDLAAGVLGDALAHDDFVRSEELVGDLVADTCAQVGRTLDVRE